MSVHLYQATQQLLSGLKTVLTQVEPDKYCSPSEALLNSTIGQHTRHTLEFFQCLLSQSGSGVINYDRRTRSSLMESVPSEALRILESEVLPGFEKVESDRPLLLETSFSDSEDNFFSIPTTYCREWSYVLEHAVHHMAMIRMGLQSLHSGVKLPENFGVSAATVKYRKSQCAQ